MDNILEVKNLGVRFGNENVLSGLSFNLREKENLVVLGPNGAGKTVLLKCLLGANKFDGNVKWREGTRIGYAPQKFMIGKDIPLSVEEFFGFKKIGAEKAMESLRSVGLNDKTILDKKIGVLSPGQIQRILIAWALADDPDVLLFDEPTAGIDVGGEETVYQLLAQLEAERNLTIILVTHDLSVVYKFADTVLCLGNKKVFYGLPNEVLTTSTLSELYGGEVKLHKHDH